MSPTPFSAGVGFARQRMLVDHRHALDDDAVHRHHLPGVNDHDVAFVQLVERDLCFLAVHKQPDEARLLAERAEQHFLRVVLGVAHQNAAEAKAPGEDGAGQHLSGAEAGQHDDGIEHVDAEPPLLRQHPPGSLEAWQRGVGEQRGRYWQERWDRKLRDRGERQRRRANRKIAVDFVEPSRMLHGRQRRIEDFDELRRADLAGVVFDVDPALRRIGVVAVHAEHAHQLTLNRVAQRALAIQHRVPEPHGADAFALRKPSRDASGVATVAYDAVMIARGGDRGDRHRLTDFRVAAEDRGQLIQ